LPRMRFTSPARQDDRITRGRPSSSPPTRRSQRAQRGEQRPAERWHSHEPTPSRKEKF